MSLNKFTDGAIGKKMVLKIGCDTLDCQNQLTAGEINAGINCTVGSVRWLAQEAKDVGDGFVLTTLADSTTAKFTKSNILFEQSLGVYGSGFPGTIATPTEFKDLGEYKYEEKTASIAAAQYPALKMSGLETNEDYYELIVDVNNIGLAVKLDGYYKVSVSALVETELNGGRVYMTLLLNGKDDETDDANRIKRASAVVGTDTRQTFINLEDTVLLTPNDIIELGFCGKPDGGQPIKMKVINYLIKIYRVF